uniref:Uncharacterized protein n=1 Tax=Salix viminalis TaxID=40686 RepID=A0A6N2LQC7_SALVM
MGKFKVVEKSSLTLYIELPRPQSLLADSLHSLFHSSVPPASLSPSLSFFHRLLLPFSICLPTTGSSPSPAVLTASSSSRTTQPPLPQFLALLPASLHSASLRQLTSSPCRISTQTNRKTGQRQHTARLTHAGCTSSHCPQPFQPSTAAPSLQPQQLPLPFTVASTTAGDSSSLVAVPTADDQPLPHQRRRATRRTDPRSEEEETLIVALKATTGGKEKKRGRVTPDLLLHRRLRELTRHQCSCAASTVNRPECKRVFKFNHRMEIGRTSSSDQQIMDQSHEVSLDINEIATSLRDHLKTKRVFSRACCIYRVPARLRRLKEEAYTPRVVSIGPIHHGKENLKAMEDHKIMYLQEFLERSKVSVEDLINVVRDNETELRDCYAESIDLSRKDFATMILLDAIFIIMVLLKRNYIGESNEYRRRDQIFFRPFKVDDVVLDMCLLENQLPFFFLEKLFGLYPTNCTIMKLTFEFLQGKWRDWVNKENWEKINSSNVLHFVDLLKRCQQPEESECQQPEESEPAIWSFSSAPTATELHQSGVKFKNPERNSLIDVRFSNGILEIPQLAIDDNTEILFRNVQTFEQCHHQNGNMFVSNYISFISGLVRAPNDVEVLVRNENLKNLLNSDEAVSNILYQLQQENYIDRRFLIGIRKDLNSHCRKRRHKWKATLKMVYFNNPWTGISVAAAAFLLILNVVQTVCSILQL